MKLKALLTIALTAACAVPLFAATKHSTDITLDQPVKVAATELKPGAYKLEWRGAGPQVNVNFLRNDKVVATSPAKLEMNSSPYQEGAETQAAMDNTKVLKKVFAKQMELAFPAGTTAVQR